MTRVDPETLEALAWLLGMRPTARTRTSDSDRSGEASETPQSGSTVGESAGPKDIAQGPKS